MRNREIKPVNLKGNLPWITHWKDWCWSWSWSSGTLATWYRELTYWKRLWCWEGLRAGGEGDNRGWDGWMASLTRWTWLWVNSGSWWWTGRPGVLQFMGLRRVGHDWATELTDSRLPPQILGPKVQILQGWVKPDFHPTKKDQWRRQWQPTPVLLSGKSHGWRSLVGCSPWGC